MKTVSFVNESTKQTIQISVPLPRAKDHFANFLHTTNKWHWLSLRDHSQHHFTHTLWTKQNSNQENGHASVLGYSNLGHLHKYLIYRVDGWYVESAKDKENTFNLQSTRLPMRAHLPTHITSNRNRIQSYLCTRSAFG